MLKKIIILFGIIVSGSVFAQAENFAGVSLAFNTGVNSTDIKLTDEPSYGTNSTPVNINASYTFVLLPKATLAVGVNYDLIDTPVISSGDFSAGEWLLKNHYSINIEPGYIFNENTIGYLKLAYHSARSSYFPTYTSLVDEDISGTGYGFGTKIFLGKDFFLNLEIQQTEYGAFTNSAYSPSTIRHTTTTSTIGVGYKF